MKSIDTINAIRSELDRAHNLSAMAGDPADPHWNFYRTSINNCFSVARQALESALLLLNEENGGTVKETVEAPKRAGVALVTEDGKSADKNDGNGVYKIALSVEFSCDRIVKAKSIEEAMERVEGMLMSGAIHPEDEDSDPQYSATPYDDNSQYDEEDVDLDLTK